jgi:hypothetical protein
VPNTKTRKSTIEKTKIGKRDCDGNNPFVSN